MPSLCSWPSEALFVGYPSVHLCVITLSYTQSLWTQYLRNCLWEFHHIYSYLCIWFQRWMQYIVRSKGQGHRSGSWQLWSKIICLKVFWWRHTSRQFTIKERVVNSRSDKVSHIKVLWFKWQIPTNVVLHFACGIGVLHQWKWPFRVISVHVRLLGKWWLMISANSVSLPVWTHVCGMNTDRSHSWLLPHF